MKDFYNAFYAAIEHSQAHRAFCERVFGVDLGQHGFADLGQLELLLEVTALGPQHRLLDLGCGDGRIAEYLSDRSGAHVTGTDFIPAAIALAQQRTAAKSARLSFFVGDINRLELPAQHFDLILSIDSIYFSEDYDATVRTLLASLRPGGRMAFFYSHGREPWVPVDEFPADTLSPERTPLAQALTANRLAFHTWDLTRQDYELAQRRKQVLADLLPQFEAEATRFLYDNRLGDANGISQAIEDGLHRRYLYLTEPVNN